MPLTLCLIRLAIQLFSIAISHRETQSLSQGCEAAASVAVLSVNKLQHKQNPQNSASVDDESGTSWDDKLWDACK